MSRRKKVREPTREERLYDHVRALLAAKEITPEMVFNLLWIGHRLWIQGLGVPVEHVDEIIAKAFADAEKEKQNES